MTTVLQLAQDSGLKTDRADLTVDDLFNAGEIFLTGTAAEVIPVTKIDGKPIGSGKPGPVTRQLVDDFHRLVAENAPED